MQLNEQQKLAVAHYEGPCMVTSVPGSGKTRVLTARTVWLIKEKKVDPRNILAITFTNKAANEMKERILRELAEDNIDGSSIWISTFHKLCLAILRKHGSFVDVSPNFGIYSSREQEELMMKIARMNNHPDPSKYGIMHLIKAANDFREDIIDFQQHIKELSPTEVDIVQAYQEFLDKHNVVDFSGMLYKAWMIMEKTPAVVKSLRKRFQFVLVDEMQDTNRIQYEIVKHIAGHGNLFVVFDENQCIYKFRGAKPENLQQLRDDFNNVNEITLPKNYRSTSPILDVAQRLIRNNKNAEKVELHSVRGDGPDVRVISHRHADEEAYDLAYHIKSLREIHGYNWKDFAVLYRTNSLSRAPEMALRSSDIPYRLVGGFSFFDRMEIKAAFSYLALLSNPNDTINFNRAIARPKRGLGPESIGQIERICEETGKSILEVAKNAKGIPKLTVKSRANLETFVELIERHSNKKGKLSELAEGLIKESGLHEHIRLLSQKTEEDKSRIENLEELISSIVDYEEQHPNNTLTDYLQSIQLMASADKVEEDEDAVKLSTIHSAKGLEWPSVNIIGVEEGCIPHFKCKAPKEVEEERRLLYVGITRAKNNLTISHCHYRRQRQVDRSPFLYEI